MKKATKLSYKFNDKPYQIFGDPTKISGSWGQSLVFVCEPAYKTKKELLQKRTAIVRDVAAVFAKYGIGTKTFNRQNRWI